MQSAEEPVVLCSKCVTVKPITEHLGKNLTLSLSLECAQLTWLERILWYGILSPICASSCPIHEALTRSLGESKSKPKHNPVAWWQGATQTAGQVQLQSCWGWGVSYYHSQQAMWKRTWSCCATTASSPVTAMALLCTQVVYNNSSII